VTFLSGDICSNFTILANLNGLLTTKFFKHNRSSTKNSTKNSTQKGESCVT